MKNIFSFSIISILFSLLLFACQEESKKVVSTAILTEEYTLFTEKDSVLVELIKELDILSSHGKFQEGLAIIATKLPQYKDNEKAVAAFNIASGKFYNGLQMPQQSLSYLLSAYEYFKKYPKSFHFVSCLQGISGGYLLAGELDSALVYTNLAEQFTASNPHSALLHRVGNCQNKGAIYFKQGKFLESLKASHQAAKVFEEEGLDFDVVLGSTYLNLASVYASIQQYDKAVKYYEQTLKIYQAADVSYTNIALLLNNWGNNLSMSNNNQAAIDKLNEARQLLIDNNDEKSPILGNINYGIGQAYYNMKNPEKTIFHFQKAIDLWEPYMTMNHPAIASCLNYIGAAELEQKNYAAAEKYTKQSIQIATPYLGANHEDVISGHLQLAETAMESGDNEIALHLLDTVFVLLNYDSTNPDFENINGLSSLPAALNFKGNLWYQKYQETNKMEDLASARQSYQHMLVAIDKLLGELTDLSAVNSLYKNINQWIENALEVNVVYANIMESTNHEDIFQLMEKAKDVVILETLRRNKFFENLTAKDTFFIKEKGLKNQIAQQKAKVFEIENSENVEKAIVTQVKSDLFEKERALEKVMMTIKEKYQNVAEMKYSRKTLTVAEVQNQLLSSNEEVLIEYFVGTRNLYAYVIQQNSFDIYQIEKDFPLNEWITQLRCGILAESNYKNKDCNIKSNAANFYEISHLLYQKIFEPLAENLPKQANLIIVPDGMLSYVPFDVLVKNPASLVKNGRFSNFLIEDFTISYAYSAAMQSEMQQKKFRHQPTENLIAYAPSFRQSVKMNLSPLTQSEIEAKHVTDIIGGKSVVGSAATKAAFIKQIYDYSIVHLSTHGDADEETGDFSSLAFYSIDDNTTADFLYNSEIYFLNCNAEMVVLSACETSIGELQKGEGIISLARGFSYAGAKSIVTSLWNVNEKSTAALMGLFYQNIAKGMPKNKALRQAKLDYMELYPNLGVEPFYWAGFVPIGDMSAVEMEKSYWWLIGGLMLFFIAGIILRKLTVRKK